MQIFVTILILSAIAHGFVTTRFPREVNLPAPTLDKLRIFYPSDITIKWNPVKSDNERILGYKVRLWEQGGKKIIFVLKAVNGEEVVVEEIEKPKITDVATRNGKLLEYRISGAEQSQITLHGLKKDTPYLIEVLAYSAKGDGPPSPGNVIEIHSGSDIKNKENMASATSAGSSGSLTAVDFKPNVKYE